MPRPLILLRLLVDWELFRCSTLLEACEVISLHFEQFILRAQDISKPRRQHSGAFVLSRHDALIKHIVVPRWDFALIFGGLVVQEVPVEVHSVAAAVRAGQGGLWVFFSELWQLLHLFIDPDKLEIPQVVACARSLHLNALLEETCRERAILARGWLLVGPDALITKAVILTLALSVAA